MASLTHASSHGHAEATWRPQANRLGLLLFILSETFLFGAFISSRFVAGTDHPEELNQPLALGLTLLMGFAFINQSFYLLSLTEMDLAAGRFELLVYTIAISHMIMLMAAMLYLVVVAFRALGGQETSVHHDGVKSAALLWDAMVLVYGLIWISIYVMK